jgi:hypothetical protein
MITEEIDISVRLDGENLTSKKEFLYGPIEQKYQKGKICINDIKEKTIDIAN